MSLTARQTDLVQSTFHVVQPVAATAGQIFYKRLFEIDPTTARLFRGGIEQQAAKFMQVLALAVSGLSNMPTLVPVVQQLGLRHAGYGVRPEQYDSVREALLWMLALVLQDAYTEEVRSAWAEAYAMLAGIMMEASWDSPQGR